METPEDVAERVRLCLESIPAERLSLMPDCGFFPVPRWVAVEKLKRLAAGAALARARSPADAGGGPCRAPIPVKEDGHDHEQT